MGEFPPVYRYYLRMISIEHLLSDIARAYANAADALKGSASILADPEALLGVLAAGEDRRQASERRLNIPVPRFCIFSVTWRCNLDCVGCYAKNYTRGRELGAADVGKVIRQAAELGSYIFVLVGGEPLMVPGLLAELAAVPGALFLLFTNGTLLDTRVAEEISRVPNVLPIISTEGLAAVTDDRRGAGVGEKVASAMRELAARRVPFGFSSMVTHKNLSVVTSRAWFDQLWQAGARMGFLIDYVPLPHGRDESLVLTEPDMAAKLAAVNDRYAEARPLVVNFPPDEYVTGPCQGGGRGLIHINADGYVEPCPFSHMAADNVLEKPLEQILASPFLTAIREQAECPTAPHHSCHLFEQDAQVRALAARTGAFCTERL